MVRKLQIDHKYLVGLIDSVIFIPMAEEKPLDEYEFFNKEIENDSLPQYLISKNHRNYMLICVGILILSLIRTGLSDFFPHITGFTLGQNKLITLLLIVAESYYYYFLINYFRHYKLNALMKTTWALLIFDVGNQVFYFVSIINMEPPQIISTIISIGSVVSLILWVVLLLRLKATKYISIKWLKHSALAFIVAFFLMFTEDFIVYMNIYNLPIILQYVFVVYFVLNLKTNEEST